MNEEKERLLIIRPLGPQGPRIGIRFTGREDLIRLDEAAVEIAQQSSPDKLSKTEVILLAAQKANIDIIDN